MQKHFYTPLHGAVYILCPTALLLLSACASVPAAVIPTPTPVPTATMIMENTAALPADAPAELPVSGPRVTISNFTFSPDALTVPVGSTVTWINQDDIPHTVTSVDKVFASPALDTGDRFSFKFTTPGTYSYFCSLHPKMVGKIIVQ